MLRNMKCYIMLIATSITTRFLKRSSSGQSVQLSFEAHKKSGVQVGNVEENSSLRLITLYISERGIWSKTKTYGT